jgi:hypothetical protein
MRLSTAGVCIKLLTAIFLQIVEIDVFQRFRRSRNGRIAQDHGPNVGHLVGQVRLLARDWIYYVGYLKE